MPGLDDYREVCERAARAGGQVLMDWAGKFQVREKGPSDLVTEADLASQEVISQTILGAFPRHGFLAEENSSIPSQEDGLRWIVDPLDGTTNYVHAIPAFCVSIALEQAGKLLVGTIYDPVADQCYSATTGQGATVNGRTMRVSNVSTLDQAVVSMSLPTTINRSSVALAEFVEAALRAQSVRRMGSSALNLCFVAAGRFDGYWSSHSKIWDVAAGLLLVEEAGGVVTSEQGGPFRVDTPDFIAASNVNLHKELQTMLESVRAKNPKPKAES